MGLRTASERRLVSALQYELGWRVRSALLEENEGFQPFQREFVIRMRFAQAFGEARQSQAELDQGVGIGAQKGGSR